MSTRGLCDMYLFIYNYFIFIFHISYPARKKIVSSVLNSPWSTQTLQNHCTRDRWSWRQLQRQAFCAAFVIIRASDALHTLLSTVVCLCSAPPLCVTGSDRHAGKRTPTVTMEAGKLRAGEWHEELSVEAQRATGVCTHGVSGSWKKPQNGRWVTHKRSVLHYFVNSESACSHRNYRWRLFGLLLAHFKSLCVT